jgi:NAD(P)-dependent dehydrogenase (short-subunit alcohol dehydrogenase family)
MKDLAGKVAVVTGAASGIGNALAHRFAADGMKVVLADIEAPALDDAAERLAARGADVLAVVTDTSVAESVDALAARTIAHFGAVHVICNNAGVGSRGLKLLDVPRRDLEWVLGVNLWGVMHGIWSFLPHLRAQNEGHVINTASISGLSHRPRMGPYNASKAAVVALSETLQFELDDEGSDVGVTVVCPGWVRTNISQAVRNLPEQFHYELTPDQAAEMAEYKAHRKRVVSGSAVEPEELATQVRDAIVERRFYVFTDDGSIDDAAARFDRIIRGDNPVSPGLG